MTATLAVEVSEKADGWRSVLVDAAEIVRRAATSAWQAHDGARLAPAGAEVSIVLADDRLARQLNRDYRGKDRPTNVLSFASGDRGGRDRVQLLGDVVLALETIVLEAAGQSKPLGDHVSHLVVHGMLHLLGYDHRTESDAVEMETLEVRILAGLGIGNPYRLMEAPPGRA